MERGIDSVRVSLFLDVKLNEKRRRNSSVVTNEKSIYFVIIVVVNPFSSKERERD